MAKKPKVEDVLRQNGGLGPSYGQEVARMFPQIASWLCDLSYEDGSPKGRTKLEVERKGDRVRVMLKSADSGMIVEAHHSCFEDAILTMELLLSSDDCPWQLDPFPWDKPKTRKKSG